MDEKAYNSLSKEQIKAPAQQLSYPLDEVSRRIIEDIVRKTAVQALPVGSVYIATVDTDPATLLGYGTWEAIAAGKVLVGIDPDDPDFDTLEETFGSKTHTLTVSEMPAHQHPGTYGSELWNTNGANASNGRTAASTVTSVTLGVVPQGGDQPHNNVQPSFVVCIWKRTA